MNTAEYHKCPSASEFKSYLQGNDDKHLNSKFEAHIQHCEFCKDAVAGYKHIKVDNLDLLWASNHNKFNRLKNYGMPIKWLRPIAYAASIIILIGLGLSVFILTNQYKVLESNNSFDYSTLIQNDSPQNKALSKLSNDMYIYINSCNQIAYNDQFLSAEQLNALLKSENMGAKFIQIEVTSMDECALQIINSIKKHSNLPVFTIKN